MSESACLLTDEQMRQFITEGYLLFNIDVPEAFNQAIIDSLNTVYDREGNPGNNLLPRVPALQQVFDHPRVKGALTSVLGNNYMMHPHRHGHYNRSTQPQGWKWHKDDYFGFDRIRDHLPWWAMIFYYPQDVIPTIGPTGLVPGSQYYEKFLYPDHPEQEVRSVGKAGTVVLVHYDMWHRANPNVSDRDRYMLKFQFTRIEQPKAPSWNNTDTAWRRPESFTRPVYEHDVIWEDTWNWLTGQSAFKAGGRPAAADNRTVQAAVAALKNGDNEARVKAANALGLAGSSESNAVAALEVALRDAFEPIALNAAYGLSRLGEEGAAALVEALNREPERISKLAAYGLSVAGPEAVKGLIETLRSGSEQAKAHAAFALGQLHECAGEALPELVKQAGGPSARVRTQAVEALGYFEHGERSVLEALAAGLKDADPQVRFTSALSAARLGTHAEPLVDNLVKALADENRYVRGHASEALHAIRSERSIDALIAHLKTSRWCPITTADSTY